MKEGGACFPHVPHLPKLLMKQQGRQLGKEKGGAYVARPWERDGQVGGRGLESKILPYKTLGGQGRRNNELSSK